jgi:hypothetical protein
MTRSTGSRPATRRTVSAVGAVVLSSVLTGCLPRLVPKEDVMRPRMNEQLDAAISDIWRHGGEARIAESTAVDWDALHVFPEGTPSGDINEVAGTRVAGGRYYTNSTQLFLFLDEDELAAAVMVSADVFDQEIVGTAFGPEARLVGPGGEQTITIED